MDAGRQSLDATTDVSAYAPVSGGETRPDGAVDAVDAAPDGQSGRTDGASDGAGTLSPFPGYRWVALPAPRGTHITAIDGGMTFNAVQVITNGVQMGAQLACDGVQTCYGDQLLASCSDLPVRRRLGPSPATS